MTKAIGAVIALLLAQALVLMAAQGGTASAAPLPVATHANRATTNTYVALGDSYAAGFGLPAPATPTRTEFPGCAQTSLDYPHRLATQLGLHLGDATCSGATTADFFAPQATAGPHPPAQLAAVKKLQPALVTITIGGNDLGFTSIAQNCLAVTAAGPLLLHPTYASCSAYFASTAGAAADPVAKLDTVRTLVTAAVAAVRAADPGAKIVVMGYPTLAPDAAHTPALGCFNANAIPPSIINGIPLASTYPFTDTDTRFLESLTYRLDDRLRGAARAAGAIYTDVFAASLAHSPCAPESVRWVEPVVPGGGGTNVLHPSLLGTAAMATDLVATLG